MVSEARSLPVKPAPVIEPIFDTPPDACFEGGKLAAWFTDPPGAVVQLLGATVFSKEMAEWIVGTGLAGLERRYGAHTKLRLLLDIRPMLSREPAALQVIMGAGTQSLFRFERLGVVPPLKPPPLYMTTLHGAIALLSAIVPQIRVYETTTDALLALSLQPSASSAGSVDDL
jgi:hypothetical protein